jgi:predicted  nucleic acid-binding Zn ribbon protein
MKKCYYYIERKTGESYEDSRIKCLCTECKAKLFPKDKMMFYTGIFGTFDVQCTACDKLIYKYEGEQWQM